LHVDHVHISHFLNIVNDRQTSLLLVLLLTFSISFTWFLWTVDSMHKSVLLISLWCHVVLSFLVSVSPFFIILWKLCIPSLLGFTGLPTSCQYSLCPVSRRGWRKLPQMVTFLVLRETCLVASTFKVQRFCQSVSSSVHFHFIPL
jgi:hypothetical protein